MGATTATPIVRFTRADAETATLIPTAAVDNRPETDGSKMLTLVLGSDNAFDLGTRINLTVTINNSNTEASMPRAKSLGAIA